MTKNTPLLTDQSTEMTGDPLSDNMTFKIINFNCNGFKSSHGSVFNMLDDSDCMFLSETWLKPCELSHVSKNINDMGYWCNLKSSVDPETILTGRPYGGVGFICKKKTDITYVPLPCDNDRIMAVQVVTNNKVCLTMIGVYLPFYDGSSSQVEMYNECLQDVQCIIDTNDPSPILMVGDMNASLPFNVQLSRNWYKGTPFTRHSYLLYDFVCQNELYSCNFDFNQDVHYTYHKNNAKSYIDHVLFSNFAHEQVIDCKILCLSDIVSDHLPIKTTLVVRVNDVTCKDNQPVVLTRPALKFPRIDWSDNKQCEVFATCVKEAAKALPVFTTDGIYDRETALNQVNSMCDSLTSVLHNSVRQGIEQRQASYQGRHKKNRWWNRDCLYTRDRQRFWYRLWKAAGKPRSGHVFSCYKLAKKSYRTACRFAVNGDISATFKQLDFLQGTRNINKFWNLVRRSKCTNGSTVSDIGINTLHNYYSDKFNNSNNVATETVHDAEKLVKCKYTEVELYIDQQHTLTESELLKYIGRLRTGCAPGIDGISAEHLKWSKGTQIIPTLCKMLALCVRFGIVGDSFTKGLLIPLLKKPNADPTVARNYRPVVISNTFSKILEIHMLDECGEHEFHDLQFGFINTRGTAMAAAMTYDLIDFCVNSKSPVYCCALDAEGAFDGIPHSILFAKALDVIPMLFWRLLIFWYTRLVVQIKWGNDLSQPITIRKGTRQGGLSSPFLFNLLYQDLVEELSEMHCGIAVEGTTYNLCCYADDLLLCSLTISGLQKLIDAADAYINGHGLSFNPQKTVCVTFGKSSFNNRQWYLQGSKLQEATEVKHLGVILSNDTRRHADSRIQAARRAFYSLQGAGLCVNGCNPSTIAQLYTTAVRPVLSYGLECISLCDTVMKDVVKTQSKFLKAALGVKSRCRSSPLLQALKICDLRSHVEWQKMSLYRNVFTSSSRTKTLYKMFLTRALQGRLPSHANLTSSVLKICHKNNISLVKFICDKVYKSKCKTLMKSRPECGLADSVRFCLFSSPKDDVMLNNLLSSY